MLIIVTLFGQVLRLGLVTMNPPNIEDRGASKASAVQPRRVFRRTVLSRNRNTGLA